MLAFYDEMGKIAAAQSRAPGPWSPKTIGAPRSKLPGTQSPKAPTAPGKLDSKLVRPASSYGKRQNYSHPNQANTPDANPAQNVMARNTPPPNVVFGVR